MSGRGGVASGHEARRTPAVPLGEAAAGRRAEENDVHVARTRRRRSDKPAPPPSKTLARRRVCGDFHRNGDDFELRLRPRHRLTSKESASARPPDDWFAAGQSWTAARQSNPIVEKVKSALQENLDAPLPRGTWPKPFEARLLPRLLLRAQDHGCSGLGNADLQAVHLSIPSCHPW